MDNTVSRKKIFAANWKMYKNTAEALRYFEELKHLLPAPRDNCEVIVFPPALSAAALVKAAETMGVKIGVQNIHWHDEGSYTGEISAPMAVSAGALYCLCGHSERRQYFDESDEMVTHKTSAAIEYGLTPVVCIGETLYQRESSETLEILETQLAAALAGIRATRKLFVAYEPIWAVGTGITASPADAQTAASFIRRAIAELWDDYASEVHILYGGSVKPQNIAEIMRSPDVDGVLVGGAGLKADSFAEIVKNGLEA